ncbi:hypothetical protein [Falsiroseomonas sp.]|uniref:hypothetical protein n=1 Tax=Falsiroseomonas sp. TaxID=2870721 RepID=UPI003562FFC6
MASGLLELLLDGFAMLAALLLAVALLRLGLAAHDMAAPRDAEAVPLLRLLALGTGTVAGAGLLAAAPDPSIFHPARIFAAEGPWAIGLGELLGQHALPRAEALQALPAALFALQGTATAAAWIALAGLACGGVLARRLWRGRTRLRAFAAFLLLVLLSMVQLHYTAHLLAWLAAQLGFWLFALALLLFQRWRYARCAAH